MSSLEDLPLSFIIIICLFFQNEWDKIDLNKTNI